MISELLIISTTLSACLFFCGQYRIPSIIHVNPLVDAASATPSKTGPGESYSSNSNPNPPERPVFYFPPYFSCCFCPPFVFVLFQKELCAVALALAGWRGESAESHKHLIELSWEFRKKMYLRFRGFAVRELTQRDDGFPSPATRFLGAVDVSD